MDDVTGNVGFDVEINVDGAYATVPIDRLAAAIRCPYCCHRVFQKHPSGALPPNPRDI